MATAELLLDGVRLECRRVVAEERLGHGASLLVLAYGDAEVDVDALLGEAGGLHLVGAGGDRTIVGVVEEATVLGTAAEGGTHYELLLEAGLAHGRYRRRAEVFQHLATDQILAKVLAGMGWAKESLRFCLDGAAPQHEYLVQYLESDEEFIIRLCDREGWSFATEVVEGKPRLTFFDAVTALADKPVELTLIDDRELAGESLYARDLAVRLRHRPGRARVRDYDPWAPVNLEGTAEAGNDSAKKAEIYLAPGGFSTPADGSRKAKVLLERVRAKAAQRTFVTNAVAVAPGRSVKLHAEDGGEETELFAHASAWSYQAEGVHFEAHVASTLAAEPWGSRPATMRPTIHGLHTATVTGAPGEEIHPDEHGSVFVRFPWDRLGPTDHKSSKPVRALQANTTASMAIPRVGWEVLCIFEDGDPNRPLILGRGYNAKQMPPVALPANRAMTVLRTYSSPGGGGMESFSYDDTAGKEHLAIHSAFDKATTVAEKKAVQVMKKDQTSVKGSQSLVVAADETLKVATVYSTHAATQSVTVGACQSTSVGGEQTVSVVSETVMVGGALLEKVGNPVDGLWDLGANAAIAVLGPMAGKVGGAVGGKLGSAGEFVGSFLGTQALELPVKMGLAALRGQDPWEAGWKAAASATIGKLPFGGAIETVGNEAWKASHGGKDLPWKAPPTPAGAQEGGGGASTGQVAATAAIAGSSGDRKEEVAVGALLETIGGATADVAAGAVTWQTNGVAAIVVGGSHVVRANKYTQDTKGACVHLLGAETCEASGTFTHAIKTTLTRKVAGAFAVNTSSYGMLKSEASVSITAASLKLRASTVTFCVGSTVVSCSPGGIKISGATVTVNGETVQSSGTAHG